MPENDNKGSAKHRPETIKSAIDEFISQIESLSNALPPTIEALTGNLKKESKQFRAFIEQHAVEETEEGKTIIQILPQDVRKFERATKHISSYALAIRNVPITFLVSLVSHFDAYLGNLLRVIFINKPELLNASQKQLTYSELQNFKTIDDAKEHIIERELDSIIRESHASHFDWMEQRFNVTLKKDLDAWPDFIEITERRNLFVHCDGIASKQYINVCKQHGYKFNEIPSVGDHLHVPAEYFDNAFERLFEVAVKLGHVLWRKLFQQDRENADYALNHICFNLLIDRRFMLAKQILLFSNHTLKKYSSERFRLTFKINLGIAYKELGENEKLEELISSEDWSASSNEYRLAIMVLNNDFKDAANLMTEIGDKGTPSKEDYSDWPLFNGFRKSKHFQNAYKEIFGTDFVIKEESPLDKVEANPVLTKKKAAKKKTQVKAKKKTSPKKAITKKKTTKKKAVKKRILH